jgi:16S rRNA processing protein RimM
MTEQSRSGWIALARIMRPQGRKGEVLAELLTDYELDTQFRAGRLVSLAKSGATQPPPSSEPLAIEEHWLPVGKNAGRIVLKLAGHDTISQAELLSGLQVMVPASELPSLEEDTYYVSDLVGCTLFNGDQPAGLVVDVQFAMSPDGKTRLPEAAPLLGIQLLNSPADDDPILVPFVLAHLESVDLAAKRITMNLPEGLLDQPETIAD